MIEDTLLIDGRRIPVVTAHTAVVGTGAAGFAAADRLRQFGVDDVVMITDKQNAGTSRNAGSDKQTYYKLTLAGDGPDSVKEMADTLFAGGAMDGDIALVEAAMSARCFYRLVEAGVPFPQNRFGEFIGYKTDHDPRVRATSVGPFTSKAMTEALEASVVAAGIPVLEDLRIVDVLTRPASTDGRELETVGLLCLRVDEKWDVDGDTSPFLLVRCANVVFATGGPAGMYADAVFPHGQWGASGAAFRAGVHGKNLTEWQFGMASVAPRWNVSGTYMQVLPRFVSTDKDGGDEREFLTEFLPDYGRQLSLIFLKGYQWPFDVRKAMVGSSLIDVLVYQETVLRGRRVFLDFRANPFGTDLDPDALEPEARDYLANAGALTGTPLDRLLRMNTPAYEFYLGKGVDLAQRPLEIAVCAQHNNGGLAADAWWHSDVAGFFPVGEVNGTHGVYRPGGSALNSGQVGATRAAQYIAARRPGEPLSMDEFASAATAAVTGADSLARAVAGAAVAGAADNTAETLTEVTELMSASAAAMRNVADIESALAQVRERLATLEDRLVADAGSRRSVNRAFLIRDILTCQLVYLSAMAQYATRGGKSRGSVLVTDADGDKPLAQLPELFRFRLDAGELDDWVQVTQLDPATLTCSFEWRQRRPIPADDDFFENVWRSFRETGNVY